MEPLPIKRRVLQAHASLEGPPSPTMKTQNKETRHLWRVPVSVDFMVKFGGFQEKRSLQKRSLFFFIF